MAGVAESSLERTAAALRASEERLRTVVGRAPIVLWAVDRRGIFTLSDGAGLHALGLEPGQAVGQSVFEMYADFPEVIDHVRRAMAGEELRATVDVGNAIFESHFTPLRDGGGRVTGVIGVSTDVTERATAERALRRAREETIHRLARAVEVRSAETGGHIDRMGRFCELIARRLGMAEEEIDLIRVASPMHDVGKLAVPDSVLLKPGPLNPAERAVMQTHAEVGRELLAGSGEELPELAATITWTHHERFDGSGYPRGLERDQIPLEGRIAAVGDVFDALTHDRIYRAAMPVEEAVELMRRASGAHFDPDVLDCFLDAMDDVLEISRRHAPAPA
ncbi:MAG: HD domain-containing protein [Actinomycetota bacterium]|nr:HD domain-containing protein [Actinomycetota bacterium]